MTLLIWSSRGLHGMKTCQTLIKPIIDNAADVAAFRGGSRSAVSLINFKDARPASSWVFLTLAVGRPLRYRYICCRLAADEKLGCSERDD
jgi:hypothetical protein